MKFGKRLRRECHLEWETYYLDYKGLKKIIKNCVLPDTRPFFDMLESELEKLNDFFCGQVALFEEMFPFMASRLQKGDPKIDSFMQWCDGLDHLRKYVVLNYIAVRKIVKKFDKNTNNNTPVPPILAKQPFYNSLSLAKLITKTEILVAKHNGTDLADSFLCPVCLEILHAPVVLSCAHIFCWSCLARAAQFTCNNACPVCRKEVPLDPMAYKVDSLLQRFLSQNLPEQIQRKGFGYFFQTPPPPRNLKVIVAPGRFASPHYTTRFSAHCNQSHTDAQFCVIADNSPSFRQAITLSSSKVLFVDTPVDPAALGKGETLVPFIEGEGETTIGKLLVIGFRVGLPGSEKPTYEKQHNQSRPALIFMKHLPFDVLEKTSFDKLLKKHANGPKYLFILDAPTAQAGVWNSIPFTKLSGNSDTFPMKDKKSTSSSITFPYIEAFIKQDNILIQDRTCVLTPLPPTPTANILTTSTTAGHNILAALLLDNQPDASPYLDVHPFQSSSSSSASSSSATIRGIRGDDIEKRIAFEDNVWSVVWRGYLVVFLAIILYYYFA